jgi:selenocysteine-specific elongation factor
MILGTAGHIDHGKTALVRALTGVDTDRLPEEKRRGITIELGFAPLQLPGTGTIGVVDVPGHEAFVRTMLAGATGIDLALLIVAADEGVMPQTREHVAILGLLGVRAGVVVLTKRDLVDDDWLALVEEDVRELLRATPLADAAVIPTSVVTGAGLDEVRAAIEGVARALQPRDSRDLFRMPIDRAFSVHGTGTVVTGTVWSGSLARDATVRVFPGGSSARVRGIQTHGRAAASALPGQRTAIALVGVEVSEVGRGAVLVDGAGWGESNAFRADVVLLPDAPRALTPRTRVRLHLGTSEVGARVVALHGSLEPGDEQPTRIVLDAPLVARAGDRFVLRSASPASTIGGGVISDPLPPPRRVRPFASVHAPPAERLEQLVREAGAQGLDEASLPVRLGLRPADVASLIAEPVRQLFRQGGRVFAAAARRGVSERLLEMVAAHQRERPLEPGASLQSLRAALRAPTALTDAVLRELLAVGTLEVDGGLIRTRGWSTQLTAPQRQTIDALRLALNAAGREPASVVELSATYGESVLALLHVMERDGEVVAVEEGRYYVASALAELMTQLRAHMERGREYGPAELRDILGVSRKFLIPLLEFCDRRGVTQRRAGGRVILDTTRV